MLVLIRLDVLGVTAARGCTFGENMEPHVCPLCNGRGYALSEMQLSGGTGVWIENTECHACDGKGIVWPPYEPPTFTVRLSGNVEPFVPDDAQTTVRAPCTPLKYVSSPYQFPNTA